MAKLRYFDARPQAPAEPAPPAAVHTEFLRTGRINRGRRDPQEERYYISHEDVAEKTARRLQAAGEKTHTTLNNFHPAIRFPKMIFHRTLSEMPHLGYCHVTASRTQFARYEDVSWAFYIANFYADIAPGQASFVKINQKQPRMYFAVAVEASEKEGAKGLNINSKVRGNGIIFRTDDPQVAIRNVLLLGAPHEQLRDIVRQL